MEILHLNRNELKAMLMGRNVLSNYFNETSLPAVLENSSPCLRCHQRQMCDVYHQIEGKAPRQLGDNPVLLSETDLQFLHYWETYLTHEESGSLAMRQEIWNLRSEERESVGRCLSHVYVQEIKDSLNSASAINRFKCSFRRHASYQKEQDTLNNTQMRRDKFTFGHALAVGEPVVISRDQKQYGLAKGFIESVSPDQIVVGIDRKIPCTTAKGRQVVYRIDKDEMTAGIASMRYNLFTLFSGAELKRLKSLIVDLAAPSFDFNRGEAVLQFEQLNDEQNAAIRSASSGGSLHLQVVRL
jgi:DNA replication ATP-dependent helicase Dna2